MKTKHIQNNYPIHTANSNLTWLDCWVRSSLGGVNWTTDPTQLLSSNNLKTEHVQIAEDASKNSGNWPYMSDNFW